MHVSISVSDPWDFGEAVNWQRFSGEMLYIKKVAAVFYTEKAAQEDRGLIQLDKPVEYHGLAFRYLVVTARLQGRPLSDLDTGNWVPAGFLGISDQQAESEAALDTSKWRGGRLAFTGAVEPVGQLSKGSGTN